MDLKLGDKRFLVTGGSSGIGLAVATSLTGEGAHVTINGRDPDRVAKALRELAPRAEGLVGDIGSESFIDSVMSRIETSGPFDGAFVSVGGPSAGEWSRISDESWRDSFETVFIGPVRLLKTLSQSMPNGGAIVVVLSTSTKNPIPHLAVSSGIRPGLAAVIKLMADELGPKNIRVLGILPGRFDTERARQVDLRKQGSREASLKKIPLGRLGDPDEIGRIGAILLSPIASYMTGSLVAVDGGMMRAL